MADLMFALVAIFAFGAAVVNLLYVIRRRGHKRSWLRGIQALVCTYVGIVMVLDAVHITDMTNISGYLLLLGMLLVLAASMAEGIVDL